MSGMVGMYSIHTLGNDAQYYYRCRNSTSVKSAVEMVMCETFSELSVPCGHGNSTVRVKALHKEFEKTIVFEP